jgi:hypothetical protein
MVSSNARDPEMSLANTLDKNIHGGVYNTPRLVHLYENGRRVVGLPGMEARGSSFSGVAMTRADASDKPPQETIRLDAIVPVHWGRFIQLAMSVGFGRTRDEIVSRLLQRGWEASRAEIANLLVISRRDLDM